ncbi:signal peptidase complex subunit 2-like [Corticium candelabrum]|uniref:signal peptidase complex subunit 2-like n=1 Tax=Corticium candelabrum TaxID=121492 RepID=UPI002E25B44E|nr:signal peptidase complex subunit 2-like [Corticium candelabrum]
MTSKKGTIADKWFLEGEPVKVEKWDGSKVKHALDDAAKKVMGQLGYDESHEMTDKRLAICTLACALSLIGLVYDYFFPFPASKYVLGLCAVGYFSLMVVFTIFVSLVEKNYIYWGIQRDKAGLGPLHYWSVQSTLKRYEHMYTIVVAFHHGNTKQRTEAELTKSIGVWFDTDGVLLEQEVDKDIRSLHSRILATRKEQKQE